MAPIVTALSAAVSAALPATKPVPKLPHKPPPAADVTADLPTTSTPRVAHSPPGETTEQDDPQPPAAVGLACGLHYGLDGRVENERTASVAAAEKLLRQLRLKGVSEDAVQQFVCRYSGDRWEEFFEALFGFEAKVAARRWWQEAGKGKSRPKFAGWREPLLAWIAAKQKARRVARERRMLQKVEEKGLKARGMEAGAARRQSEDLAAAMVEQAAEFKQSAPPPGAKGVAPHRSVKTMLALKAAVAAPRPRGRSLQGFGTPFGPKLRFLLGALLLVAGVFWARANFRSATEALTQLTDQPDLNTLNVIKEMLDKGTQPLQVPLVPAFLTSWVNTFNVAIAGALLVLSAMWRGGRVSLLVVPGALLMAVGPALGLPERLGISGIARYGVDVIPLAAGAALVVLGLLVLRERE